MGNYVSISEVRDEGVPATVTDDRITARISKWEAIVERVTNNVFYEIDPGELTFDGNNMPILHFNIPLISVTSVKINSETTALDSDEYRSYTGMEPPRDDRRNPKIEIINETSSIFNMRRPGIFAQGLEQKITATWGFVDPDPSNPGSYITPPAIKDAIIQLIVRDLDAYYTSGGSSSSAVTPIKQEKTDGHSITYQDTSAIRSVYSLIPQSIYETLMFYRSPLKVSVPDTRRLKFDGLNYQLMAF